MHISKSRAKGHAPLPTKDRPAGAAGLHVLATRAELDALFRRGASVTAGAPSEAKFLIDRRAKQLYFLPPEFAFHFDFYRDALHGTLDGAAFNQRAYNRPDRDFIAGTVTAYDSYVDAEKHTKGILCFSLWPTDRFDAALLKEIHVAVRSALLFLKKSDDVYFRPGGPIQDRLVASEAAKIKAAGVAIKTNLEISKGLRYVPLSEGASVGRLVVVEAGAAVPLLSRTDVALFLGDVPPTAPPLAGIVTTRVQTYNSHLGIKYRQDDTPYFYKSFEDAEVANLKKLAGTPVQVTCTTNDGTIVVATEAQAKAYLDSVKPKGHVRLAPNLRENRARTWAEMAHASVSAGRWSESALAAFGRKTLGVVQLVQLARDGKLKNAGGAGAPKVVTPYEPMGIPANWYTRFLRTAVDGNDVALSARVKAMIADPTFKDAAAKSALLSDLRRAIEDAKMPEGLLRDLRSQLVEPYLAAHPNDTSARIRSSAPVVEDGGNGPAKLPNMAGAFDSHTAKWKATGSHEETIDRAVHGIAEALRKVYASVWNERAVSELEWHNVDLDEESVAMAALVMPNQSNELANGVLRVNADLAGFFSITGETQIGENLVTNPEEGATPDTFIDGNYDVLNDGTAKQDIAYERLTNVAGKDTGGPARAHAMTDAEIHAAYDAMKIVRSHFAALEGKSDDAYVDECEVKVLADGTVQLKQERPWVE